MKKAMQMLLLIGTIPLTSRAQCCSGGVPMSNSIGLPSASVGTFQFSSSYDWNNLQTLKAGDRRLEDNSRQRETHSIVLELGYVFSEKISLDILVPYIWQVRTITIFTSSDKQITSGVGDLVILPKYSIVSPLSIGMGIKLNTGKSDFKSERGIALPADLQPGSGAIDLIFLLAYQEYLAERPSFGYFGKLIFRKTGINKRYLGDSEYQFGNEFQTSLGISDRFLMVGLLVDPSLIVYYRKRGRDFFEGNEFPGSGGDFVFINPGISVALNPKMAVQLNTSVPIYSDVQDTQLSPTVQINIGFNLKTNLKSRSIEL